MEEQVELFVMDGIITIEIKGRLMKKIIFVIFIVTIVSCGFPTIYEIQNNSEFQQLQCLVLKKKMYVFRTYNVCPMFSNRPVFKNKYWKIIEKNKQTQTRYIDSLEYRDRVFNDAKTCYLPTLISYWEQLDEGTTLYLDRYVEGSDTISNHRLLLYGKRIKNGAREFKSWSMDVKSDSNLTSEDRILSIFSPCSDLNHVVK